MSLILSIAVLAFVAYDFVLLSRMRKALNASMAALDELEALIQSQPTKAGEIVVDLKIDASQASEVFAELTRGVLSQQDVKAVQSTSPDSPSNPGKPPEGSGS